MPFSYNITTFWGNSIYDAYEKAPKIDIISYVLKDANGVEKGQYFDIKTGKIVDSLLFGEMKVNIIDYSYDKGASGIYYNVTDYYVFWLYSRSSGNGIIDLG